MIFVLAAAMFGGGGAILGGVVGAVLGVVYAAIRPRPQAMRRREATPASAGCVPAMIGGIFGVIAGGAFGMYHCYRMFFSDGPSHGYPDRASYRAAEMDARAKRLEPVLAALEKYKADHGRYPAKWHDLVEAKYLDSLPPKTLNVDHLGQPNRVDGISSQWCFYSVSPARDEFVLRYGCQFNEDKRGMGVYHEMRVYSSATRQWADGPIPPWPAQGVDPPPPAAPPQGDKKNEEANVRLDEAAGDGLSAGCQRAILR